MKPHKMPITTGDTALFSREDPRKRCTNCGRPRDNNHQTLCAICEYECLNVCCADHPDRHCVADKGHTGLHDDGDGHRWRNTIPKEHP